MPDRAWQRDKRRRSGRSYSRIYLCRSKERCGESMEGPGLHDIGIDDSLLSADDKKRQEACRGSQTGADRVAKAGAMERSFLLGRFHFSRGLEVKKLTTK